MNWMFFREYDFEEWCIEHKEWMEKNLNESMVKEFTKQKEELSNDVDKHVFMLYHLMHMANSNSEYLYEIEAKQVWELSVPMMQAFNAMLMSLAYRAGDEQTHHAIGLANALTMKIFSANESDENELRNG